MDGLIYLSHRPDEVLDALRRGEITAIDTAVEELPDLFLLYAIDSGLLDGLADSFPDPRYQQPEIAMRILLAAGMVGHFAGLYALSQSPYALHSPGLLTALGVQVVVKQPGNGLSRRGTKEAGAFHGDVVRKLLDRIADKDEKASRLPGQSLIDWYNANVGAQFCRIADAEPMIHILDCTDLVVNLENDHYERSGITKKDGKPERGYKLATLRSLLDSGAVITGIAWGAIQDHDLVVTHDLVRTTEHLHAGDMLLEDRGFIDAATITHLKLERGVDVCTGLKSDMVLMRAAAVAAEARPGDWQPHPTRPGQKIQLVTGLSGVWEGLGVPMNVCVVRYVDKKTGELRHLSFATTDLTLTAKQVIETYQVRPEIEEDYRQLKSSSWQIDGFFATRLIQIIWHVCLTLSAYNLFQVYANTEKGRRIANKTKQRLQRERRQNPVTYLMVCTQTAYGVYETGPLLYEMLGLPDEVREKIRRVLPRQPS